MLTKTVVTASANYHLPDHIDREDWAGLMTDSDLWGPVVDDICTAVGIAHSGQPVAGYPGSSAVFIVDETAVIKLFPPLFARDFDVEFAAYQLLRDRTNAVPNLIAAGTYRDRIDWPFLVLGFCPGEPVRTLFDRLTVGQRVEIARQVGHILRAVHQTPVANQQSLTPWPDFLAERWRDCLIELRQSTPIPAELVGKIEDFLAQMVPQLLREPGVLLNADLTEDHVLLTQEGDTWHVQAVIDWADAEIGPPAYEWIAAWFSFCRRDPPMFAALVSACTPEQPFDEEFRRRLLAYTFLHRFGPTMINDFWWENPPEEPSLTALQDWLWPRAD